MSRSVGSARLPLLLALVTVLAACDDGPAAVAPEGTVDLSLPWRTADPEAVGLDAADLYVAGELGARIERLRSLVVVRDGRLAFERYYGGATADSLADVRSVTKSIVSTLAGVALAEGAIRSLDQPITDFVPRELDVRPEHASVSIRHLLTMTGGFEWSEAAGTGYADWVVSPDPVQYLLDRELVAPPGTTFRYNSAAVHLLGVVIESATGMSLPDYADKVLFEPLGIGRRQWEPSAGGYVNGGSGLDLRPRDLARLGQLQLQQGWSGNRSIVPEEWIDDATAGQVGGLGRFGPVDRLSYGYLWWLDLDIGASFAWGYGGQFVYVAPAHDMVVVATTDWRGERADVGPRRLEELVLDLIVERVLGSVE